MANSAKKTKKTAKPPAGAEKPVKTSRLRDEIWAIVIVAIGAFLIVALQTAAAGQFGAAMKTLLMGCFGFVAYVLPYYLILYGILLFIGKAARLSGRSVLFFALIFLLLTVINAARFIDPENLGFSFSKLPEIFDKGVAAQNGGFFGTLIGMGLTRLIGTPGLYILCIVGILISLLLVINTPLSQMLDNFNAKRMEKKRLAEARKLTAEADAAETEGQTEKIAPDYSILSGKAGTALKQTRIIDYVNDDSLFENTDAAPSLGLEPGSAPEAGKGLDSAFLAELDIEPRTEPEAEAAPLPEPEKKPAPSPVHGPDETAALLKEEMNEETYVPPDYILPPLDLLKSGPVKHSQEDSQKLRAMAQKLEKTLNDFSVDAKVIHVAVGPAVTRYEIQPGIGVKVSSIKRLEDDIALNLEAKSIRIEAPIPGKAAVGIEVSNDRIDVVALRDVLESKEFINSKSRISFAVGMDIAGKNVVADLKTMPHLLIAGSTGSGKSVCINSIIMSLLFKARPDEVRLILIDPKVVELGNYNGIPHLLVPVVTEAGKAAAALNWAVMEMNERFEKFGKEGIVRDLESYNNTVKKRGGPALAMAQIVIIIDELADLMIVAPAKVEEAIQRLTQMGRAAGVHLIVATQRPSVDVITGVIKANTPSRIAFAVSSQVDSRTILDMSGAEHLVGKGDMLFNPLGQPKPLRVQGTFVSDSEVHGVLEFVKQQMVAEYSDDVIHSIETGGGGGAEEGDGEEDELLPDAIETVVAAKQASASMLQRRFRVGYNRAARL
ncbi:MAG: DNA translocase FtsK, partial [Clostridiales Family XIII bacterium]|nr:DNA translocase FtsK [Clostridiales Family XIII bacterium]